MFDRWTDGDSQSVQSVRWVGLLRFGELDGRSLFDVVRRGHTERLGTPEAELGKLQH